jgi:sugar fermentation stimulation protein A
MSQIAEWSIPGFGSTDCSCETHLFAMASNPIQSEGFQKLLQYFRMDRYSDYSFSSQAKPDHFSLAKNISF